MRRLFALLALIALAAVRPAQAQGYKVVVNEANSASSLSAADVSQMFLKKKTSWPSGAPVVPVDQAGGPARAAFSDAVLGKDVNAVKLYWQQQVFAGRAQAPEEKPSDAAVVAFVKDNPGAIGYVSASAATAGVKVVPVK